MASKNVSVQVDDNLQVTKSDLLTSDCLSVECVDKINLAPNTRVQVNLIVRNTSSLGRMANLFAHYDLAHGIRVQFAETRLYVGPESRTVTFALIEAQMNATGKTNVTFGVS